ncbi:MAG: type II toxin-antitoxin system VapC family toxin [Verrucomicrobia bacterium]|jgi:predicted nucleic acid-binding protein|nr:type II toxin-antitoxin system VapC family toxin [Verrucomicrobiota bacterium]
MTYLVDTNVLSELCRPNPHQGVMEWFRRNDSELGVSVLTMGELVKGIQLLNRSKRRSQIENWYRRIETWTEGRLFPVSGSVMNRWGAFYAYHQKKGRKLNLMDSLIAATALEYQLVIATRNESDFPDGVDVLNPWKS